METRMNKEMTKIVMERANKMLDNPQINAIYQAHNTLDEAQKWIIKAAIATLVLPVENR